MERLRTFDYDECMIAIIYGEDTSRMQYKLDHLKQEFNPDVFVRLDAEKDEPKSFFEETASISLFPEHKMVVLDNADFLSTSKESSSFDADAISRLDLEDGCIVYLVHKPKLDGRKKAVKVLQEKAKVIECRIPDERSMPSIIRQMIAEKGLQFDPDALNWYIAHAGLKTSRIDQELDKFSVYSDHLSLVDVQAMTTVEPVDNVFRMTDALFMKQGMKLLALYRSFRKNGMEPVAICALLASQVRFVYQVRVMMDLGKDQNSIASALKASSGRIYNTMKNASRFSASELLSTLCSLSELDQAIKRGLKDKDQGFEDFIFEMIEKESVVLREGRS